MKNLKFLLTILSVCYFFGLKAQSIDDILFMSRQDYEGSARFASMGGAFGALGGDMTSLSINPAGISVYRSNNISFTSSFAHTYNNANLTGIRTGSTKTYPGISSAGFVYATEKETRFKWNFGIAYLKKASFNRKTSTNSEYTDNSIMKYFAEKATDIDLEGDYFHDVMGMFHTLDWDALLAGATHLINWDNNDQRYYADLGANDKNKQQIDVLHKGYASEVILSTGVNIDDKLYIGATAGIPTIKYEKEMKFAEFADYNNESEFINLMYNTNLKMTGYGFNIKLGAIYKPIPSLRLGLAFHSPDYFSDSFDDESDLKEMDNRYYASMDTEFRSAEGTDKYFYARGNLGNDYSLFIKKMNTPFKAIASLAYIIGRVGLVSMDCEYIDYSKIKLKGNEPKDLYNSDINKYFKSTFNLRFGTEFWIKNIALRAGYAHNPSPDKEYDLSRNTYTAGIGYRYKSFQCDIAYTHTNSTEFFTPYSGASRVMENITNRRLFLTLGWRFSH